MYQNYLLSRSTSSYVAQKPELTEGMFHVVLWTLIEHFVPLKFQKAERLSMRYYCTKHGRSWWLDIYQSKKKEWKSLYEILCVKSVNIIKANQICLWKMDLVKQIWFLSWRRLILVGKCTGKSRLSWSTHLHAAQLANRKYSAAQYQYSLLSDMGVTSLGN